MKRHLFYRIMQRTLLRDLPRCFPRPFLACLALLVSVGLVSCPGPQPPWGKKVDVGGYELFYREYGEGSPTVVLLSGLNDNLTVWWKVQYQAGEFAKTVSYDRGGVGWSDNGPNPRDGAMIVDELRQFLDATGIAPPYVFCAHSFAGLFARLYARSYPDEVLGIVLVDTTHEDRWDRQARQLDPNAVRSIENIEVITENVLAGYGSTGEWYNRNNTFSQVRSNRWLPDIPLILLSQGLNEFNYLQDDRQTQAYDLEREMDQEQAMLTPRGLWEVVEGAGHMIHQQRPEVVVDAIRRVIEGY